LGGGREPISFASSLTRSIPVELGFAPAQIMMSACLAPISTPSKVDRGGFESGVSFPSSAQKKQNLEGIVRIALNTFRIVCHPDLFLEQSI
jgi:hypothetical protein